VKAGWQVKKLRDVATLQRGFDLPTRERVSGEIPLVSSSGVSDTHNTSAVRGPGVVTGRSGSIGNVFFIEQDFWPLNTVLYVKEFHGNDPRFVFHLLNDFDLKRFASGAGVPTLNRNFVHDELVNIPPLPEQQRIVGILDEAFDGIATAKANAEKNLQNARALFESHLQAVFIQRGEGWVERPLFSLCVPKRVITYGVIKLGDEIPDGVPCLRTSNVRWLHISRHGMKRISPVLSSEYSRTILKGGEVLVNVRGTLGGVAVVAKEMEGWNVSREVAVVPVDPSRVNPAFLSYLIGSGVSQQWLGAVKKGAAYVGINIEDLRLLPVSVPKMVKQLEIVHHLMLIQKETQRLESIYQQKLAALGELKKSLLHRAFSGQL
jgi:type I restriction enzyme, S subunit